MLTMTMTHRDSAVLVLSASRGLGRGIAEALAAAGFTVGVGCRRQSDALEVSAAIHSRGDAAVPIEVDVTRAEDVAAAVSALTRSLRLVEIVNNAGVIHPIGSMTEVDPDRWAEAVQVNLMGPYHGVRYALPHMEDGGVVVNVSSGAASNPLEGWSAYCCSKAGLAMLTRMIDHECRQRNIYAYDFRPGLVDTDMQADIRASGVNPVSRTSRADLLPVSVPARVVAWLVAERPADLAGKEVSVHDETVRARAVSGRTTGVPHSTRQ